MPKVPLDKVYERSRRLHKLTEEIAFKRAKMLTGIEDVVPIVKDDKQYPMGRTFNYKPAYLDKGKRGVWAKVKYYDTRRYAILGTVKEFLSRRADSIGSFLSDSPDVSELVILTCPQYILQAFDTGII